MNVTYAKVAEPSAEIAEALARWENDPELVPVTRHSRTQAEMEMRKVVTTDDLAERLRNQTIYLVSLDGQLIGELSYAVDPSHLYKQEKGTAWIGITIGEEIGRGKGIGSLAMQFLEDQVRMAGHKRVGLQSDNCTSTGGCPRGSEGQASAVFLSFLTFHVKLLMCGM